MELINNNYVAVKDGIIPQPASAQLAEIVGLAGALELLEGRTGNIKDSAYADAAVHVGRPMWVKRELKRKTGATVKHCDFDETNKSNASAHRGKCGKVYQVDLEGEPCSRHGHHGRVHNAAEKVRRK